MVRGGVEFPFMVLGVSFGRVRGGQKIGSKLSLFENLRTGRRVSGTKQSVVVDGVVVVTSDVPPPVPGRER